MCANLDNGKNNENPKENQKKPIFKKPEKKMFTYRKIRKYIGELCQNVPNSNNVREFTKMFGSKKITTNTETIRELKNIRNCN